MQIKKILPAFALLGAAAIVAACSGGRSYSQPSRAVAQPAPVYTSPGATTYSTPSPAPYSAPMPAPRTTAPAPAAPSSCGGCGGPGGCG